MPWAGPAAGGAIAAWVIAAQPALGALPFQAVKGRAAAPPRAPGRPRSGPVMIRRVVAERARYGV